MYNDFLIQQGEFLLMNKNGKVNLGQKYKDQKNWFLYYDLSRDYFNVILGPERSKKKDMIKASQDPIDFDSDGCFFVPRELRTKLKDSLYIERSSYVLIICDWTNNV